MNQALHRAHWHPTDSREISWYKDDYVIVFDTSSWLMLLGPAGERLGDFEILVSSQLASETVKEIDRLINEHCVGYSLPGTSLLGSAGDLVSAYRYQPPTGMELITDPEGSLHPSATLLGSVSSKSFAMWELRRLFDFSAATMVGTRHLPDCIYGITLHDAQENFVNSFSIDPRGYYLFDAQKEQLPAGINFYRGILNWIDKL